MSGWVLLVIGLTVRVSAFQLVAFATVLASGVVFTRQWAWADNGGVHLRPHGVKVRTVPWSELAAIE